MFTFIHCFHSSFKMNFIKTEVLADVFHFWNAIEIYYQHPNSINKQILFSEGVLVAELESSLTFTACHDLVDKFFLKLQKECNVSDSIKKVEFSDFNIVRVVDVKNAFLMLNKMCLLVRKLISHLNVNDDFEFFEFIFLDMYATNVHIFTKYLPKYQKESHDSVGEKNQDPYIILKFNFLKLVYNDQCLEISYDKSLNEKGVAWLQGPFTCKFKKLMSGIDLYRMMSTSLVKLQTDCKVDIIQYCKLYKEMKLKYAKHFVKHWTENTDPKKFVYEDIGIATYLLMLWNEGNIPEKNSKKQNFVDLGCGNGLLVHILNSEGHSGIGIDIRKRKIWDVYPATTVLQEKVIIPTSKTTYPEADWLIGNHSDELTAWIPIMARLSNTHCQYFVLPCCPYQLNGMKFQRKNSGFSSYQDFISYVYKISELCEFETCVNKLRIPSTKRICLIGLNKTKISQEKYVSINESVIKFITQECQFSGTVKDRNNVAVNRQSEENEGLLNIKMRNSVEPVRNCTKLPQEFTNNVLKIVMDELLREQVVCRVIKNGKFSAWNRGRRASIGKLVSCLNKNLLKQLKNECKGLQTLLKNHHFLFEVTQGYVQFRNPESMLEICRKFSEGHKEHWKVKKCWLFNNHPDKCPLTDDVCSYSHEK